MMERSLDKLRIKTKDVDVGEGIIFQIQGLSFPDLAEFGTVAEKQGNAKAATYLLKTALRRAITKEEVPDDKLDEFINTLSSDVAIKVITAVKELSGLDEKPGDDTKK